MDQEFLEGLNSRERHTAQATGGIGIQQSLCFWSIQTYKPEVGNQTKLTLSS